MQAKERPDEYEKMETRKQRIRLRGLMLALMLSEHCFLRRLLMPRMGWGKTTIQSKGGPVHRAVKKIPAGEKYL